MNVAIIGGGAAGFFSAISVKEHFPHAEVTIFEKSKVVLAKVKVSGGGRCNVTNAAETITELCKAYPRGGSKLKKLFAVFSNKDAMEWLQSRSVPLTIQDDKCVFPKSQDSETIISCFLREAKRLGIKIETRTCAYALKNVNNGIDITFGADGKHIQHFRKVIITTGGSPQKKGLHWLEALGHEIAHPVPSLFTFTIPNNRIRDLMGVVVENAAVRVQGTKLKAEGALLITHWGMSGPAILTLSSFGARVLSEMNYNFRIQVNWVHIQNNEVVYETLTTIIAQHQNKLLANFRPCHLPERLWLFLLEKVEIAATKKWNELGKKDIHKLVNILTNDEYHVQGKSTFREEFVTCGGVSLESVDSKTLESKVCPNLYFAGEVLDIDAITGGFNFQAAWTTGFIAGRLGGYSG